MDKNTHALVSLLARLAYNKESVELSSGRQSEHYVDAKKVTYHPEGFERVGLAVHSQIRSFPQIDAIGGLTMGADAIIAAAICASKDAGSPIPGFVVRKEAKRHGLQQRVEGVIPVPGSKVAIVDDVVTSGGSVLSAVKAANELDLEVVVVIPLVDREEGGSEDIRVRGIAYRPICTLNDIVEATEEPLVGLRA